ncbi:methylenetetrahydrofolate reductase [Sphingomonas glaciei]|uniref:Methylenetetrahydrofolate reductase n=1 Tax=Sphingomonas glaciei TaxID=2938948 RepID=A0ABY5MSY9_9SPHN|nr:methylenetetrahydrofolate reductase [Sphingomonas glaciei]UUR06840.1 methylenetetrahydrofolate reductase [Sphingomonas glaciei]
MASSGRKQAGIDPLALLDHWSIEITAKDVDDLVRAAPLIPEGTKIPVTFLPNETFDARVAAAATVRRLGFIPIPHLSARRIHSREELEGFLSALQREAAIDHAFVVAGDPPEPMGPFADALALIQSDLLAAHGVTRVGISGYPEGHPEIGSEKLWDAGRDKRLALQERGHDFAIVTQFSFDAGPVLEWIARQRAEGINALIRVGVPGPASVKTLLRFAARCGVGASAKVMSRYGLSMTRLLGTAGPDRLIEDLAAGLEPAIHGDVRLHFYPFGGIESTAAWIRGYGKRRG